MTHPDGRFRHASGEDADGCLACFSDEYTDGVDVATIVQCQHPEPDPAEPELCAYCSHMIERVA